MFNIMIKISLLIFAILSNSLAKLIFSPSHLQANIHEAHMVNLTSDSTLPENTVIDIFSLPNENAAEISRREIVVKDSSQLFWSLEVTIKGYGVTSFIARVRGEHKPDEAGSVQVKVTHSRQ